MKQVFISKYHNRTIYTVREYDHSGTALWEKRYDCTTSEYIEKGFKYILLKDRDGRIRQDSFYYLNVLRKYRTDTTRRMMGQAIQEYETFCDIYNFDRKAFSEHGYEMFKRFLFRTDMHPLEGHEKSLSINTVAYVKSYIGSIVKYLESMGYDVRVFKRGERILQERQIAGGHIQEVYGPIGDTELRDNPQKKHRAPEHMNPTQMKELFRMIQDEGDMLTLVICLLGFGYGLRRGEITGITLEDIVETIDKETGEVKHLLLIRNRISDRRDQHAKTLRKPKTESSYSSKDFTSSVFRIGISERTYKAINDYYTESRNVSKEEREEIDKVTLADSLDGNKENHYIFIGRSRGISIDNKGNTRKVKWNVLTGAMVNYRLDKYLKKGKWELRNKCHALRHSFAMYHAYYSEHPLPIERVSALLRHASISSTEVYFNLPEAEKQKLTMIHSIEMEKLLMNDGEK